MKRNRLHEHLSACLIVPLVVVLVSCGPSRVMPTVSEPVATTVAEATTGPARAEPITTVTPTTLAGEDFGFGPQEGEILAVVGVAHDDVLNVRAVPGVGGDVVAELEPVSGQVVATGRARRLPTSIWYEVTAGGVTGWVSASYLAFIGSVDDATAELGSQLGEDPTAATMAELGAIVAEALSSADPPSVITMVAVPTLGELGEVTYDVIGIGDDAIMGLRLHVLGRQSDDGFTLETLERTWLCSRGVTEEGLCV